MNLRPLHHWPIEAVMAVQASAYGPHLLESAHVLAAKMAAGRNLCLGLGAPPAAGGGEALRGYAIALPWHSSRAPQWNHAAASTGGPAAASASDCVYLHDFAIAPAHPAAAAGAAKRPRGRFAASRAGGRAGRRCLVAAPRLHPRRAAPAAGQLRRGCGVDDARAEGAVNLPAARPGAACQNIKNRSGFRAGKNGVCAHSTRTFRYG